jgi:hypothetical protein
MLDLDKTIYFNMSEALLNGCNHYLDSDFLRMGKSGGYRCPTCKGWIREPSSKKINQFTYLVLCEECERQAKDSHEMD